MQGPIPTGSRVGGQLLSPIGFRGEGGTRGMVRVVQPGSSLPRCHVQWYANFWKKLRTNQYLNVVLNYNAYTVVLACVYIVPNICVEINIIKIIFKYIYLFATVSFSVA
jgi:hypothetical protein